MFFANSLYIKKSCTIILYEKVVYILYFVDMVMDLPMMHYTDSGSLYPASLIDFSNSSSDNPAFSAPLCTE